jgi:hypothetical protein
MQTATAMVFTKEQILGCIPVLQSLKESPRKPLWKAYEECWESHKESTETYIFKDMCHKNDGGQYEISEEVVLSLQTMSLEDLHELKEAIEPLEKKEQDPSLRVSGVKTWADTFLKSMQMELDKKLAFSMALHPRLGGNSPASVLSPDDVRTVHNSCCARCGKHIPQ